MLARLARWLIVGYLGLLLVSTIAVMLLLVIDYLILGDPYNHHFAGNPWTSFGHLPWPVAVMGLRDGCDVEGDGDRLAAARGYWRRRLRQRSHQIRS